MVRNGRQQTLRIDRRSSLGAALVLCTVAALAALPATAQNGPKRVSFGNTNVVIETLRGRKQLRVLYARSPRQLQQGLMFRRTLKPWDGMLFDLKSNQPGMFWMRNTYIPLDIIFIRADGTVDSIGRGVPLSEKPVMSKGLVRGVLELRAGRAKALGIDEDTVIRHKLFGNTR